MGRRKRWHDLLAFGIWAVLVGINLAGLAAEPTPLQAGFVLFNFIVMSLFLFRRPATLHGSRSEFAVAAAASFMPILLLRPTETGYPLLGLVAQDFGLALMIVSIIFLNRSFGIAPAHRGLVTGGAYRLLRHPLYAGEIVFLAGYCLGYASTRNWIVWLVVVAAQLARIGAEENLLSTDPDYRAYQARVRWRLVPGVW